MSRPVLAKIKLMISAGAAKPAPPVGPALGQHGLNIMEFCKAFNAKTADFNSDAPIPVVITAYKDKSFEWEMRTPPVTYFVRKAAGVAGGGQSQGDDFSETRVRNCENKKTRRRADAAERAVPERHSHGEIGGDQGRDVTG
jgi:large subunit ribosomal protein L11